MTLRKKKYEDERNVRQRMSCVRNQRQSDNDDDNRLVSWLDDYMDQREDEHDGDGISTPAEDTRIITAHKEDESKSSCQDFARGQRATCCYARY